MSMRIRPLKVGSLVDFEKSRFTFGANFGEKIEAPCLCFLLEGAGRKILVDTGPSHPDWAPVEHVPMGWEEGESLQSRLREAEVDPAGIELVVFTHLHWDHCYNTEIFPRARFLVQKEELHHAVTPIWTQQLTYEAQVKNVKPPWFNVFDRMAPVNGDQLLEPEVRLVHLPGHTPGFQGVLVQTEEGPYLIAGDFLPLYDNWPDPGSDFFIPNGIHIDLGAYFSSFAKVRNLAGRFLPGHDLRVLDREIYGAGL